MRVLSRQSIVAALLPGLLVSVLAPQLDAQDRRRRGRTQTYKHTRNSKKIRKVFAPCVAKVFAATVKVFSDDKAVAMGTVVGEAGLIVTKASELKDGEVTVAFRDEEAQHKAVELTRTMAVDLEYWPSLDPTGIDGSREVVLDAFRKVRDDLRRRIEERFGEA